MKLTAILLLTACLHVTAKSVSQTVTFSGKNVSLERVFAAVKQHTGYVVVYSAGRLRAVDRITLTAHQLPLEDFLQLALQGQSLDYSIEAKTIFIKKKPQPPASPGGTSSSPPIDVTGRITDVDGTPLAGANVKVKGTQKGTATDDKGEFTLRGINEDAVLEISYIGHLTKTVSVSNKKNIIIELERERGLLDGEVVVIGYGTQKKGNVTGSVATLSAKKIENLPIGNIGNGLAGRLPGLIVVDRGGQPGDDAPEISIRGYENMLIIVDGVENHDFNSISPSEIDNISILKDASAAIYGARAGNGVALITTKRGKTGKPVISLNANYGLQAPTRIPRQVDAPTYARMVNESEIAVGRTAIYSPDAIEKYRLGSDPNYPSTNWYDVVFNKNAPISQYNVNTSGGTDAIKYFFSLGYMDQKGLLKSGDIGYKRYNIRSNIDAKISNSFSVSLDLSGRMEQRDQPAGNVQQILEDLTFSQPIFAAYYPDPSYLTFTGHLATQPVGRSNKEYSGYINDNRKFVTATTTFKYNAAFLEGLSAKALFNINSGNSYAKNFGKQFAYYSYNATDDTYTKMGNGQNSKDQVDERFDRTTDLTSQLTVNYVKKIGKHDFSALLLGEFVTSDSNWFSAHREGYITTSIAQLFAGSDLNKDNGGKASSYGRIGYAGRFNYAYKGKYLLEASLRYDASSRYSPETQWGAFPGVSVGWRISEEKFMKSFVALDNLKIRVSRGKAGNDYVGAYNFLTGYNFGGSYVFGASPVISQGLVTKGLANANLTWEEATINNFGLEGSFWRGLFGFEFDYFYRKVANVPGLRSNSLPSTFGATLPQENINSYDNRGFELVLRHDNRIGEIRYNVDVNLTYSRAKWIHYDEPVYPDNETRERLQLSGQWKNRFFGYESMGLFQSQEDIDKWGVIQDGNNNTSLVPGDVKYADFNGDGILNTLDEHVIGRGFSPDVFFGINLGLNYKGFDFSALLQGAANYNAYFTGKYTNPFDNGNVPYSYLNDYWTPENTDARYPRIFPGGAYDNKFTSSFWLQNANYMRLKTLQLGYTIPKKIFSKGGFSSIRVYLSGFNLLTFDNVAPFDPETATSANASRYPQQKSLNVGVNLTF